MGRDEERCKNGRWQHWQCRQARTIHQVENCSLVDVDREKCSLVDVDQEKCSGRRWPKSAAVHVDGTFYDQMLGGVFHYTKILAGELAKLVQACQAWAHSLARQNQEGKVESICEEKHKSF